jgi:cytochrome c-type biogenesis protein CcmF
MVQEKRGMLKRWNMILIILTYALVIFGTFLTRSGVLSSVHAFAQSAIGPMFFAFIGLTTVVSLSLLMHRWQDLRSENQLGSLLSRESLFLVNNLLFVAILAVCFLGVLFPLISEIFTGLKVTVGPPWYERITAPLWAGLLVLMGIAPLSAYGRTSARLLGRALWKPLALSLVVPIALVASGMDSPSGVFGYWLASAVALVTLYRFCAAPARYRTRGETFFVALGRMAAQPATVRRPRHPPGRRVDGLRHHRIELFQTRPRGPGQGEQLTLGAT